MMDKILVCIAIVCLCMISASATSGETTKELDTDRMGMDYRGFDLTNANPDLCQVECNNDNSCKAYTYVKPGIQGPNARCYLKSGIPDATPDQCCVSGIKIDSQPTISETTVEPDTDRMGMDYRGFDLTNANPDLCQIECNNDNSCKAYTYVKPGIQGPNARCYLKSGVPNATPNQCCVSGIKRTTSPVQVSNIDDYFLALPSWSSKHPLSADSKQPTGQPSTPDTSEVYPNEGTESKQVRYSCTTRPYTLTKTPDKIVTFNPDMGKLWLGSLLQGNGYSGGLGSLAELPIRERAPLKIYIDLLGDGVVETVNNPDAANVQTAIGNLVLRARSSGVPIGTYISYDKRESSGVDETAINFGLSVKYMAFDVKSKLNYARKANEKTIVALFVQRAFTVGAIMPQKPSGFFTNAFMPAHLQDQINLGRIGPDNLPVFVSNIAYGRVLMFSFTSTFSSEDIFAALDASYEAASTGVKVNLDARLKKVLDESQIRVATVGGDAAAVESMIRTGDLYKYFESSTDLSTYKPISYQVDNLGDGSAARFSETINYNLRECTALPNNREVVGEMSRLIIERIAVPLKSWKNGHQIDNCSQIRFDGRQAADAHGQLQMDRFPVWELARSDNMKIEIGSGKRVDNEDNLLLLPEAEAVPSNLFPKLDPEVAKSLAYRGGRIFMKNQGGSFRIHGTISDEQGWDGDPKNSYDHVFSYPFTYGQGMIEGNSINCKINVEYRIEKLSDIYEAKP